MREEHRLYELISIISRRHGLLALDPPSRTILDRLIERESQDMRSTASDIIKDTELSRALVYRKLADLKKTGWLNEHWIDFKLCYKAGPQCETLFKALSTEIKTKDAQPS